MVSYRFAPPVPAPTAPELDHAQQRVVDHPGGPLLVLAGPGTGKTTTMVEAIVDRVQGRGLAPDSVLALTFSRKAAENLRAKITGRLGRTISTVSASTFHSFAWSLVRRHSPQELYAAPLRLLSAPEADVILNEMISTAPEAVHWPASLAAAVGTRGFAREVGAVLARAREQRMDPVALHEVGREAGRPEWMAAAAFMEQYQVLLGDHSAVDYADLSASAVAVAEAHRDELRAAYSWIFVDEYQDTDPSQVALLQALAGDGRNLVVVGDPDQSIYGFRGADVRGILDFPDSFRTSAGAPAPVLALTTTRRFGSELAQASRRIASGIAITGSIPTETFAEFRNPTVETDLEPGRVEVVTFDTARSEAEHIADLLRRAHLDDGIAWSSMAVLVRSGRNDLPGLQRALLAAGVPIEVASDEIPLGRQPAVRALLAALDAVDRPDEADYESLLTGPLGGLDAVELRAITRRLRRRSPQADVPALLRSAAWDAELTGLGDRLDRAQRIHDRDGSVDEVLWALWDGSQWSQRLTKDISRGGRAARAAHRDLDAVCALFEAAAKAEEQRDHTSISTFVQTLNSQEIPGDTLAEAGVRPDAVRLLTAHRSKGLEWELVVVAHVQDGSWPNLRLRNTLLGADRISPTGELPPVSRRVLLAEERRLFYVAVTRARARLVVTAVRSSDDDGDQPSRFLDDLTGSVEHPHRTGRPVRPMSLHGLVAELRRVVTDPGSAAELRDAAAARLKALADVRVHGRRLVPAADPATWWGMRAPSSSATPIWPDDKPVALSASALEGLVHCPAQWFLSSQAGGRRPATSNQAFGTIVHAVAESLVSQPEPPQIDALMEQVDRVWGQLNFRIPWSSERERTELREVFERLIAWHYRPTARTVVAVEAPITARVTVPDGTVVELRGYPDRLEVTSDGDVVVVDLKTMKASRQPTAAEVASHPQLGLYQLAVAHGAAAEWASGTSAGAELVQLRIPTADGLPKVQVQGEPVDVISQVSDAATAVREETFDARPGGHCEFCDFHAICPTKTPGSVLS